MGLSTGARLGPYEIVSALGAGGMGEVYRARDTRLERTVAIKVLSSSLSATPDLKARFEREAKVISQLQHPHICVLHDVGHEGTVDFLVMEFLEGESLAERLKKGPLPLDQTIRIGSEIADALDRAHRAGIVHRDLKPGNIMLTKSGAKLLDFGLAKPSQAVAASAAGSGSSHSVFAAAMTQTSPAAALTSAGTLVGTVQYMSPEQIAGQDADARSDIFGLGAVLYEMATGRRAFDGKTQASIIGNILANDPPPISSLQARTPILLQHIIAGCLTKDPNERIQSAHDVKLQLAAVMTAPDAPSPAGLPRKRTMLARWTAALLLLAALGAMWLTRTPARSTLPLVQFTIPLPAHRNLSVDSTRSLALSADGKELAFVAAESGIPSLYVRRMDSLDATLIPESEGVAFPFFSPDGQWVGFFNQGKLKKSPIAGGSAVDICEMPTILGGAWLSDGSIVVATATSLLRVPSAGGEPKPIPVRLESSIMAPFAITGTDWVGAAVFRRDTTDLVAVNLKTGEMRDLARNAHMGAYVNGRLLYYVSGSLWSAPLDARSLTVGSPATEIVSGVDESNFVPQFAASENGVIAYATGTPGNTSRNLYLVDRAGKETKIDLTAEDYVDPTIAPDGKRFAIAVRRVGEQLLAVYDFERGVLMRLPAGGGRFAAPVWTPDGKYLVFDAPDEARKPSLFRVAADGSSPAEKIVELPSNGHVTAISPQQQGVVMVSDPSTSVDLWLLSLQDRKLEPFRRTPATERQGSFSPDGQWIAYSANDSGRSEVYVAPVHGTGRWQISTQGGEQPRWSKSGHEVFYRIGTKMISVGVDLSSGFRASRPVELFDAPYDRGGAVAGYDVTPDGKTFVVTKSERNNPTEIRVVLGWPEKSRSADK